MKPFVSICCPIYNEERLILRLLNSLVEDAQDLNNEWELLLWISKGTDRTYEIVSEFVKKHKKISVYYERERTGKSNAVTQLIKRSKGEILIFTDSDVLWKHGSIEKLLAPFSKLPETGIVSGRVCPIIMGSKLIDRINILSINYWHSLRLIRSKQNDLWSIPGQIYSIKKSLCVDIPSNIVNEDAYIGHAMLDKGLYVFYEPEAQAYIDYPNCWRDYFSQKVRTRSGWFQLRELDRSILSNHNLIRSLILGDINLSMPIGDIFDRLFLLFLDITCFVLGYCKFKLLSSEKLPLWKRFSDHN